MPQPMPVKLDVYRARNGEWSYRVRNRRNGAIVLTPHETYVRRGAMIATARRLFPDAPVVGDLDERPVKAT